MSRKVGTLFIVPSRQKEFPVVAVKGQCIGYVISDGRGDWAFQFSHLAKTRSVSPEHLRDMHRALESIRSNTNVK